MTMDDLGEKIPRVKGYGKKNNELKWNRVWAWEGLFDGTYLANWIGKAMVRNTRSGIQRPLCKGYRGSRIC
jgi:hypothetical protein